LPIPDLSFAPHLFPLLLVCSLFFALLSTIINFAYSRSSLCSSPIPYLSPILSFPSAPHPFLLFPQLLAYSLPALYSSPIPSLPSTPHLFSIFALLLTSASRFEHNFESLNTGHHSQSRDHRSNCNLSNVKKKHQEVSRLCKITMLRG
jgi:hypothetical protein